MFCRLYSDDSDFSANQRQWANFLINEAILSLSFKWANIVPNKLAQKNLGKQFLFKEGKNSITTANNHKKGFPCERAEKSVNYERKAKMLLWFRFKLKQQD